MGWVKGKRETGKVPTPAVLDAGVNEEAASNGDSHFPVNERNRDLTSIEGLSNVPLHHKDLESILRVAREKNLVNRQRLPETLTLRVYTASAHFRPNQGVAA